MAPGPRDDVSCSGSAPANTKMWNYNAKGEVVTANSSNNAFDRSYEFDGIGNRKESSAGVSPVSKSYVANALNQYGSIDANTRTFDADGNLTNDASKRYTWDAENRLTKIESISVDGDDNTVYTLVATYAYDYQSRRINKTVGATETNFVYNGWNPIAEFSGTTLDKSYTWGMDLSGSTQGAGGVGGLLSVNDGNDTYYPTFDGNGNVSEYVDATGAVLAHYEYDAFGQVVASGSMKDDFTHQFSTKLLDVASGLHYYGYRYYDSSNGRWLGRDPIQEDGGLNIYSMLANDTINLVDQLGMRPMTQEEMGFVIHLMSLAAEKDAGEEFKKAIDAVIKDYSNRIDSIPVGTEDPARVTHINNVLRPWNDVNKAPLYDASAKLDDFKAGSNKCNKYVADVIVKQTSDFLVPVENNALGYIKNGFSGYSSRSPIAGEWANTKQVRQITPIYRIKVVPTCGGGKAYGMDTNAEVKWKAPVIGDIMAIGEPTSQGSGAHVGFYLGGSPTSSIYISATSNRRYGQVGLVIKHAPDVSSGKSILYRSACN